MRCRYCNVDLTTSSSFVDDEFCCDAHRQFFEAQEASAAPLNQRVSSALEMLRRKLPPLGGQADVDAAPVAAALDDTAAQREAYAEDDSNAAPESADARIRASAEAGRARGLRGAWLKIPRDFKLVGAFLTACLIAIFSGAVPNLPWRHEATQPIGPRKLNHVQDQLQQVVAGPWKSLNQTISDRAAIIYADDFRSGLDAWQSHSNLTKSWSYDAAGFIRPGPLAVFKPTVELADYRFQFLGEIDEKGLGWAFRAKDFNNYYAMKFVVVRPGPLPVVHIVRYAVINGKEESRVEKPLVMTVRKDMLYRVEVVVQGGDFTVSAQGQVVDFWSDKRLRRGGVGFFCSHGEHARLHWVEVSHQYDALGRLCAYLAPYGIEGRNGSIN